MMDWTRIASAGMAKFLVHNLNTIFKLEGGQLSWNIL